MNKCNVMNERIDVLVTDRQIDAENERKQNQMLLNCLCLETDVVDVEKQTGKMTERLLKTGEGMLRG
jgi:hypothetical protein